MNNLFDAYLESSPPPLPARKWFFANVELGKQAADDILRRDGAVDIKWYDDIVVFRADHKSVKKIEHRILYGVHEIDKIERGGWKKILEHWRPKNDQFFERFKDLIPWNDVLLNGLASDDLIIEMKDRINWARASHYYHTISERVMRAVGDRLNWSVASAYQRMSESFIREHAHQVNWKEILTNQRVSDEFKREFENRAV